MFQPATEHRIFDGTPIYTFPMPETPAFYAMIEQVSGPCDRFTYFPDWGIPLMPRPTVTRRTRKAQEREAEIWDDSGWAMAPGYIGDSPLFVATYVDGRMAGRYEPDATALATCNGYLITTDPRVIRSTFLRMAS